MNGRPLLVLRADADSRIGAGHVMRSLALAQEWRRQGGEANFIGRIGTGAATERLEAEGFPVYSLPASHPDPLDPSPVLAWLRERQGRAGWLVVDGYGFDAAYCKGLYAAGWPLLIIDDLGHLPFYHADILVNANAYAGEIDYHAKDGTMILRGPRFALLREEFRQAGATPGEHIAEEEGRGRRDRRILVTMGGADPDNVTGRVLDALLAMDLQDLEIKIVVGPLNPHRRQLGERLDNSGLQAELLSAVTDMVPLMRWADLAVSAAGSTCWELAAMGVPMVVTILADNQERLAASLVGHGIALGLGWHHAWQAEQAAAVVQTLLADPRSLREMRERGRRLVDGQGCGRVVRAMRAFRFTLRPAIPEDCDMVFAWANDPLARAASFHPHAITWPEHSRWFADRLADPDHLFFIALDSEGAPMGQVRFALKGSFEAVVSVSLAPEFRGLGLGPRLIRAACARAATERFSTRIRAFIKEGNTSSLQAFTRAGFHERGAVEIAGQQAVAMDYTPEDAVS